MFFFFYDEETGELNWIIDDNWVYINPYYVESVELSKYELTLKEGTSTQIEASTQPSDGVDPCAYDPSIIWASGDPSVATVDGGKITAVAPGTATITATATNGTDDTSDDRSAVCEVTVTAKKVNDTYNSISTSGNEEYGWCVDKDKNCVYLVYKIKANEDELKNYSYIAIFKDNQIVTPQDKTDGKFTTVYKSLKFNNDDNDIIPEETGKYMLGFKIKDTTTVPSGFTIKAVSAIEHGDDVNDE